MRVLETVDDPLRAAWFWTQRSRLVQDLTRGDGWDELATAQDLVRGLPPSAVHASVLSDVASWGALHRPGPNSLAAADRAVEYARLVGAEHIELNARATRGWLATESGSIEEGLAEMYAVRDRVFELGNLGTLGILGRISINLPSTLESVGRSEEAVAAAELGITLCHQRGLSDKEAWVRVNLSESLFALGRWNESRTAIDEAARIAHAPKARALVAVRRALLALGRGDAAEAESQVTLARAVFGPHDPQPQHVIAPARLAMVSAARQGRLAEARAEFEQVAAQGFPPGMQRYALPLLCSAAAMEADARGLPEADAGRAAILAIVRDHAKRLPALVPIWRAYDLLLEAELARADGIVAPKLWARAVAAFEALPRPYELAEARHRWAADLLAASADREQATALLIQAHAAAKRLGARHLVEETELLAGRARISLSTTPELAPAPAPETDAVSSLGLTPREQDVLRRVADGLSNRQIAEELYISPKTASVHVSNILAKLGVSGRTEAAAMTHRLHLFSDLEPTRT